MDTFYRKVSAHWSKTLRNLIIERIMHHAQFTDLPPFSDIEDLFKKATGLQLSLYTTWRLWKHVDPEDYAIFQPYIRPCHQRILLDTINGVQQSPCSLLRQLLRPYGILIQKTNKQYKLCEHTNPTVGKKDGKTITWSSQDEPT